MAGKPKKNRKKKSTEINYSDGAAKLVQFLRRLAVGALEVPFVLSLFTFFTAIKAADGRSR